MSLIHSSWLIPNNPIQAYLTLNLRAIGFDTFKTNLLTIPAYTLFILQLLGWTWLSEKFNQRFIVALISQLWTLPLLIALALIPANTSAWAKWALAVLVVGHPYAHAIIVAITSRNAGSVRTRTVASAFYNMCVQASSIIATNVSRVTGSPHSLPIHLILVDANLFQIYRDSDKPMYRTGNRVLIGITVYNIFIIAGTKFYYVYTNKRRDKIWDAMSVEERDEYLRTTKDKGNRRLDFRFAS